MTDAIKILGQAKPGAATLSALYTVPALTQTTVSTLTVCNQSSVATSFRVSLAIAGAADTPAQYIYYDVPINGNDTFCATLGISLGAGDVCRCYNTLATLSFNLSGVEVS